MYVCMSIIYFFKFLENDSVIKTFAIMEKMKVWEIYILSI